MNPNDFVITTKQTDHNKCIRYVAENSTNPYYLRSSNINNRCQNIQNELVKNEPVPEKGGMRIEKQTITENNSIQYSDDKRATSVDSTIHNRHRYFIQTALCKTCNNEIWDKRCDVCHNCCHFCLSKDHKKNNCTQKSRKTAKFKDKLTKPEHMLLNQTYKEKRRDFGFVEASSKNITICYHCGSTGHINCLFKNEKAAKQLFEELKIKTGTIKKPKDKIVKRIKKLKPKVKEIILNYYDGLVDSNIKESGACCVDDNKEIIDKPTVEVTKGKADTNASTNNEACILSYLFEVERQLRSENLKEKLQDIEVRMQLAQISDVITGLLESDTITKVEVAPIKKEMIGAEEDIMIEESKENLNKENMSQSNPAQKLDSKVDDDIDEVSSKSEYDSSYEINQLSKKFVSITQTPPEIPAQNLPPGRPAADRNIKKPKKKKNQPYYKMSKYEKTKYDKEDIPFNIDIHKKQVKAYYKKLNKGISYKALNFLSKNATKADKYLLNSEDLINAYKNDEATVYCMYSSSALIKKGKQLANFNKEHCVAKYFTIKKNYQFEQDLHHIYPALEEINSLRDKRMLYCPFYFKPEQKCYCSQFSVFLKEPDVNNNLIIRRFQESKTTAEIEALKFDCLNYQKNAKAVDAKPAIKNRGDSVCKKDIIVFQKRVSWGFIYNGNPGYFCTSANIGPISRMTLYVLLKYRKVVDKLRFNEDTLDFYKFIASQYPVKDWELRKNFIVQQIQGDRNVFIDHPEWANKIEFGLSFD